MVTSEMASRLLVILRCGSPPEKVKAWKSILFSFPTGVNKGSKFRFIMLI
jgi:hypothetical protein